MDQNPVASSFVSEQNNSENDLSQKSLDTQTSVSFSNTQILKKLIIIFFVLIITVPLIFGAYSLLSKKQKTINPIISKKKQIDSKSSLSSILPHYSIQTPTPAAFPIADMTGRLKQVSTDLELISDPYFPITYYEAGTFSTGRYAHYKRIIAAYQQYTEGGTTCGDSVFLTKDNIHYLTSLDYLDTGKYNKNKVTQNSSIDYSKDYSVPATIFLDKNFSLSLRNYDSLSFKNTNSSPPNCALNLPKNKNMSLISSLKNYDIYSVNNLNNPIVTTDTYVTVVDKADLPFHYLLSEEESYKYLAGTGSGQYATGTDNIFSYMRLMDSKFNNPNNFYKEYQLGFNTDYPDYPRFTPDFSTLKSGDFIQLENIKGKIPIYILSDSAAASIYKKRYQILSGIAKTYPNVDPSSGKSSSFQTPNYSQYIQKHPFIFIKDYWGRFVLFEEVDYVAYAPSYSPIGG